MLRFSPRSSFVYQPDGAVLRSHEAVRTMARLATAHGAEVREETAAESIAASGDGVEVVDARRARSGRRWRSWQPARGPARSWGAAGIPLTLRPTLEQSTYFDADATDLPTVIDWDEAPEQPPYIVPDPFEPGTIKAGAHLSGPVVDPDTRSFDADEARERQVADWVGRPARVPAARPLRTETCLYTRTPDEDFVLDRVGPLVVGIPVQRPRLQVHTAHRRGAGGSRHR